MANLTLRLVKGAPLTNAELDANFSNLNADVAARLLASSNLSDLTNAGTARANLGLGNVENKSAATILSELTSGNVTSALGFTPANKAGETFTGNVTVNTGADSRVFVQSSGVTKGQLQAQASLFRIAGIGTTAVAVSSDGVDVASFATSGNSFERGLTVTSTAATDFAFKGQVTAGASKYNLFMQGTADNYIAGAVGVGTQTLTGHSLRVSKAMTGATSAFGVRSDGQIQSDVTSSAAMFISAPGTQATTFTLSALNHYRAFQGTFGAGSTVAEQNGFIADSGLTGATANYGFRGLVPSGTGRWNLYMDGSASNYLAGRLGIGSTTLTADVIRVNRAIDGSTNANGILIDSAVNSDVTTRASLFRTVLNTQAAAFTLATVHHYEAAQNASLGAGSAVTTQSGFTADSTLTGATNNFGFRGRIASGTGRWNLYMDGSADNYLSGNVFIGATNLANGKVVIGGNLTGQSLMSALRAEMTIQSDVTTGARGFQTLLGTQAAAFTLNDIIHYRAVQGTIGAGSAVTSQNAFVADASLIGAGTNIGFRGAIPVGANRWNLYMDGTARNHLAGTTLIGTTTDNGTDKLQVNGSAAISGALNAVGAITQNGNQVLHAGNYTNYVPALDNSDVGAFDYDYMYSGFYQEQNSNNAPTSGVHTVFSAAPSYYTAQIALNQWTGTAYTRVGFPGGSGWNDWKTLLDSSNYNTLAVAKTNGTATGLKETRIALPANAVDLNAGNYFTKTIGGATTLTVSNVPASGTAASFILDLTNGGSATITWWSGVKWAGGNAPTLTAAGRDVLGFFTHDGGTTWSGLVLGKDVK